MKNLLCIAVACVGLAGFTSTSALAQNPAGPSSATGTTPSSVGENGSTSLESAKKGTGSNAPATTTTAATTTHPRHHVRRHRHHMRHHMRHHSDSTVTPQKPAAENPTAAPQ